MDKQELEAVNVQLSTCSNMAEAVRAAGIFYCFRIVVVHRVLRELRRTARNILRSF